jgi:hypothetical protein
MSLAGSKGRTGINLAMNRTIIIRTFKKEQLKNERIIKKISRIIRLAYQYVNQREECFSAMKELYSRPWPGDTIAGGHTAIIIQITPYGSLYRVSQRYYLKGILQREHNWYSAFNWNSETHLSEIDGNRNCKFEPSANKLYLTELTETNEERISVYYQN